MTLNGIDISKWNGEWNAEKTKSAGATFVFIKASQAAYIDPKFLANWKIAKDAKLMLGAYHYMDYTRPVRESANFYATILENYPGELPPVVDFEQSRNDNNTSAARAYLREFLEILKSRGHKPILYTSNGFFRDQIDRFGFPCRHEEVHPRRFFVGVNLNITKTSSGQKSAECMRVIHKSMSIIVG